MKKFILLLVLLAIGIALTACKNYPPLVHVNIEDGYTFTQYVGASSIDISAVTTTDENGDDLFSVITWSGTYDLNTPGSYSITMTVTGENDATTSLDVILVILAETCDMNPDQDQCVIAVEGITFNATSAAIDTLYVDGYILLQWVITPSDAENKDITIASSDETIATVSEFGYIFGESVGTVTITVTTVDGQHSVSTILNVIEKTCDIDPTMPQCVNLFLQDQSRLVDLSNGYNSTIDYDVLYPNNNLYYEIFVRKYADHNNNGVGDLLGIIDNIPYLQTLGVGGMWLMPIMPTSSDHGYDVNDYFAVNPQYGTMDDFDALIEAADAADIDVIIDLVVNHMGAHNDIFQNVLRYGTSSAYYDWFTWIDASDNRQDETGSWGQTIWYNPTDRWWLKATSFTIHSSLQDKYYFGYFSDWMPDLNLENPDVIAYIKTIMEFWLNKGVTGFRMDATSHLHALHEYPNIYDRDQANIDTLTDFNDFIVSINPDAFVVIEAWESYSVLDYFSSGNSVFDFPTNYHIKDIVRGYNVASNISSISGTYDMIQYYDPDGINAFFISNHDMDRYAVGLTADQKRQASEMLLTLPDNPFIYYGDELGLLGTRTAMPWGTYDVGMTVDTVDRDVPTVSVQIANPTSLLSTYITLGQLRLDNLALRYGDMTPYHTSNLDGYYRYFHNGDDEQLILVLYNFSSVNAVPIPTEFLSYEILYSSTSTDFGGLSPESTMIIQLPIE